MQNVLYAILVLGCMGAVFGLVLAIASKVFAVKTDERLEPLIEALPGDGFAVFADDGDIVRDLWKKTGTEKMISGLDPSVDDVWAENIRVSAGGSTFDRESAPLAENITLPLLSMTENESTLSLV